MLRITIGTTKPVPASDGWLQVAPVLTRVELFRPAPLQCLVVVAANNLLRLLVNMSVREIGSFGRQ
jgi:hypothetical protein